MAHIRVSFSEERYRISIEDGMWVCSDGPMQEAFTATLNLDLPFTRFIGPATPDPENIAVAHGVNRLAELSATILTVAYNAPLPKSDGPGLEPVDY